MCFVQKEHRETSMPTVCLPDVPPLHQRSAFKLFRSNALNFLAETSEGQRERADVPSDDDTWSRHQKSDSIPWRTYSRSMAARSSLETTWLSSLVVMSLST
eukprot:TRINITY_DN30384_c0_g1_i1.p2 TRINITY_DN30384_c0_g1~~TRINITY_DN30384_c0_g1_i1.p2  ORF type:complete len:101 (+),score=2.16 TRINITY_DN30384_c0_g1_i1:289-591(+)